ncbi:MAG TPA: GldG family protein [Acidobacteriota bacterium]|nr:GldG family protein [Acidobacteriota bacterium]
MSKFLQKCDALGLLLLVGAAVYYLRSNVWDKWVLGLVIAGGALVVVGITANYKQIIGTLGKRSTKYAGNYVVSVLLVIALVSGLNYIGQRHPKRFDLTAIGRYTLAPQTVQVLDKLNKDLDLKAFFPGGDYPPLKELLTEYRTRNPRFVHFEFVDPDKQPDVAKQYDVTAYGTFQNPFTGSQLKFGTVIAQIGDRREKVEKRSEEVREDDLTNAIIKVQRSEAKKVYFIQGHGERDPADTERTGYAAAKKALEDQGYKVDVVNLASDGKVPQDAKVLIEGGPTTEPFPQELQFLNDFLNRGGGLMVMLNAPPAPSLSSFLKGWGVKVDDDVILDVSSIGKLMGAGPAVSLVAKYETHKITDRFNQMTFFPLARSVDAAKESVSGVTVDSLFKSNPNSWGKTDLKALQSGEVAVGEKSDLKGPLSLAVALTKEIKSASDSGPAVKARMVVVGNSSFPVNANFQAGGNGNLFLNMVSWLAQDEDLISIRPKPPEDRRVILSQSDIVTLRLILVFLLPGAVLFAGIIVWRRRRR